MKRTNQLTLLNCFKLLKTRSLRKEKLVPLSEILSLQTPIVTCIKLSLGRLDRIRERVRICHNLLQFVKKMYKNHGSAFTVKWLKCCHVSLQKYLAGDPINSLRELEPALPLPRLINGCPAIINRRDREMMRKGHSWVSRYWLTLFGIYRVLDAPGRLKLETITGAFSGSVSSLTHYLYCASSFNPFSSFITANKISFRQPMSFVISQKSSPSNRISFHGLVTDFHILKYGTWKIGENVGPRPEWLHILKYMDILKKGRFNLLRWNSLLRSLDSLIELFKREGLSLPTKSSMFGTGLSQFALKQEAAGKIRVFALLDSITQSLLRPLHDFLFEILRKLPNDGTFDQRASVERSAEKLRKYGVAYSLDLSAATDRLPVALTAQILETLVGIPGFGNAWRNVIANRDFSLSEVQQSYNEIGDKRWPVYFRYAVGQPMGGLSSWAGLAITHHYIMQIASKEILNLRFESYKTQEYEDRYEILGDDIVIFDKQLALKYLEIMDKLGVEINQSKSINDSHWGFEFAKRTVSRNIDVSGISLQQVLSGVSIGSRVADAFEFGCRGLIRGIAHLGQFLAGTTSKTSFRKLEEVGLPTLSLLNLLFSKEAIEIKLILDSIVNPRYEDFDFEKSKFDLPLISLLRQSLLSMKGLMGSTSDGRLEESGVAPAVLPVKYPFSHQKDRREFTRDYEPHLAAVILQEALAKNKSLVRSYEALVKKGAVCLYKGQGSKLLQAQVSDFFLDLIVEFSDLDVAGFCDDVEDKLYNHAKYQNVSVREALSTLLSVESLIFKFTLKTEISRTKFERESSPIVKLMRKSEGNILIPYWIQPTLD